LRLYGFSSFDIKGYDEASNSLKNSVDFFCIFEILLSMHLPKYQSFIIIIIILFFYFGKKKNVNLGNNSEMGYDTTY